MAAIEDAYASTTKAYMELLDMKNLMRFYLVGLLAAGLANTASAQLIEVTDRWDDDKNVIDSQEYFLDPNVLNLVETYGEDDRVPYPSRNGKAVVDITPDGEVRWFDKIFDMSGLVDNEFLGWTFNFEVTNETPWKWSDYHFVFYDTTFTNLLDFIGILDDWSNDVVFANSEFDGSELEFWKPAYHEVGATHTYTLVFSDTNPLPSEFGIRQIATVPEPTSLALLSLGLAGLGFMRHRRSSGLRIS